MAEFWEESFKDKQTMWGYEPVDSVEHAINLFKHQGLNKILIPGFGYGRNAIPFIQNGFDVTGIEISETAIALAKNLIGDKIKISHGSVDNMPFNNEIYEGVYCYALIHLLDIEERIKFIKNCYNQVKPGGIMIFIAISTKDAMYGEGEVISKNRYKTRHGINLFFYDYNSVKNEFENFGLQEAIEINEPEEYLGQKPSLRFWQITCKK